MHSLSGATHARRARSRLLGLAGVFALTTATTTRDVEACSGLYAMDTWSVTREVPQNAAVTAFYRCQYRTTCTPPSSIEVADATGAVVPGELEVEVQGPPSSQATYSFHPATPLEVGATYRVTAGSLSFGTFTVLPRVVVDPSSVSVEYTLDVASEQTGTNVCCDVRNPARDSCGFVNHELCFYTERRTTLRVNALVITADPDETSYWRSRIHYVGPDSTEHVGWGGLIVYDQRAEYCFDVQIVSTIDGTSRRLGVQCFPHGDLPALDTLPAEPPVASSLAVCSEPPPGYEALWCRGLAESCAEGYPADACSIQMESCEDEATGDRGPQGEGEAGSRSSCAVATGVAPAASGWLALSLCVAVAALRRNLAGMIHQKKTRAFVDRSPGRSSSGRKVRHCRFQAHGEPNESHGNRSWNGRSRGHATQP